MCIPWYITAFLQAFDSFIQCNCIFKSCLFYEMDEWTVHCIKFCTVNNLINNVVDTVLYY